ncbi:hypothetical protein ACWDZ4_20120 [Streptomyces sp. NPDC003016]
MIRRAWPRVRAVATALLLLTLLILAALAMGAALDDAAPATPHRSTVMTVGNSGCADLPGDEHR